MNRVSPFVYFATLLICIQMSTLSFAQQNLASYYSHTNKAELAITQSNYTNALNEYKEAFKANNMPFASDLYNALCLAIALKSLNHAYDYCFTLAGKGVGAAFFNKKTLFEELKTKDAKLWKAIIDHAAKSRKTFDTNNKLLNVALNKLYDKDQQMHTLLQQAGEKYKQTEVMVKKSDDSISGELMKVFSKHGFLSEFNMGVFTKDDTVLLKEPGFYVMIRHNFQGLSSYDTLFAPLCKKAIAEGTLHPMVYAGFRDGNPINGNIYYGTAHLITRYKCSIYAEAEDVQAVASNTFKKINTERSEIFIPSLQDALPKILFRIQNPHSGFIFRDNYSTVSNFANSESEQSFLGRNIVLVAQIPACKE